MASELRQQAERLPTTWWAPVGRANDDAQGPEAHETLGQFLARHLPTLRAHLIVTRGIHADRAEDLLQDFVVRKFLEENLANRVDQSRGSFLAYVLTALDHHVVSEFRRGSAKKRAAGHATGTSTKDLAALAGADRAIPEVLDLAWGRQVIGIALRKTEAECHADGKRDAWNVFDARLVRPFLLGTRPMEYGAMVERFGFQSPAQAANAFAVGKRVFRRHLRSIISEHTRTSEAIEDGVRDFLNIFARAGA